MDDLEIAPSLNLGMKRPCLSEQIVEIVVCGVSRESQASVREEAKVLRMVGS